ncbi:CapA family protein [Pseudenhygromyxa sp. WMMC2535]|uniref:CapA family protein n=1 Tax=Pseudenhygromyxa sp. WMMC2535 TaxID=2712867 RepID=UPI0015517707|nr:CapA family protein [Pseudenhygromyxa sp. WMMC2535]NVB43331.1 CapA family protein [Pseudenhygromyxa sp. WMMC2535]
MGRSHTPAALLLTTIMAVGLGSGLACIREKSKGAPPSSGGAASHVGNNDPRGVDDQPDWELQARELQQRVSPRMPSPLPTDKRAACAAMLEEAAAFYTAVETDPEQRSKRLAELQSTHDADLDGCLRETSVAAAVCVKILLGDRDSEFPWLLDQCSRAYPNSAGGGPAQAGGDAEAKKSAQAPRAEALELTFVGDVIFGRYREDNQFDPIIEGDEEQLASLPGPFVELEAALRSDILVGNLETPVIEDLPPSSPIGAKFRFGSDREMIRLLRDAGFDVLSLANNHYFDLREDGQLQSPKILTEEGILAIGASQTEAPVYRVETLERQGWRVGFLAVTNRINAPVREDTPQVPYIELRDMVDVLGPILAAAREDHDLIVIAVHWGDEYEEQPNVYQQKTARALIEAGVDMVIGHHPHVLQGVERHADGLIAYSMGNFLFENTNEIPRLTGVLRARWTGARGAGCLDQVTFHSAYIKRTPYPHPTPATGYLGRKVRERVIGQAKALGTTFAAIEDSEDLELVGLGCGPRDEAEPNE